jgi:hypothetical protein
MERVYAHLSKHGCRNSGFLADPDLTGTVLIIMNVQPKTNILFWYTSMLVQYYGYIMFGKQT